MFKGVDHLVIAVRDVEQAVKDYETKFGLKARNMHDNAGLGIRSTYVDLGDSGVWIELAQPVRPDSVVQGTLDRRGEGIHSVAMVVDNLEQVVAQLKEKGVRVIGGGGASAIHPKDTHGVIFQLAERRGGSH